MVFADHTEEYTVTLDQAVDWYIRPSQDPVGEPVRRANDDVLGRLAAIDHRLHQISTQLTTIGTLLNRLDEIGASLETLIESLRSTGRS